MDKVSYVVTPTLIEETIEHVEYKRMGKKMMICLLTTKNGHEIIGQAGIIDHRNFSEELGKQWALHDAKMNLTSLLAYQVQDNLHNALNQ